MTSLAFTNGTFIITVVFALVCLALVGAVFFLMNTDKKKKKEND